MANLTTSNSDFLFKYLQDSELDEEAMLREHALLAWSPNETDFTSHLGKYVAVEYVNPQGAGTTEALAASTRNPSAGAKFLVPQRHYTVNAGIQRIVLQNAAAGGSESEFADALVNEVDGCSEQFGDHLERQMWGSYLGYRGVVASFTTTTVTLTNASDAQMFEVGQTIQSVDPAGPTLRAATAAITAINRTTGVLTGPGSTLMAAIANSDFLVGYGDFTNFVFNGLPDWVPTTVSGSDSYLGVNRSTDRERLAGIYYDGSAKNTRAACISGIQHAKTMSGPKFNKRSPCFIHPKNLQVVLESVEAAKVVNLELKTSYGIGLEAVEIMGYRFVESYACPLNYAFVVGEGAFVRGSSGKQPQIDAFGQGNSGFHYDPDTGLLNFTMSHDGNTYSRRPYQLLRIALPAYAG